MNAVAGIDTARLRTRWRHMSGRPIVGQAWQSCPLSAAWRQPSGRGLGAIVGPCVEGDRRARCSLVNSVDDRFEHWKPPGWHTDARSDYDTIVFRRSQLTLDCRPGAFIRSDEADVALPSVQRTASAQPQYRRESSQRSYLVAKQGRRNPQSPGRSRPAIRASAICSSSWLARGDTQRRAASFDSTAGAGASGARG